MRLQFSNEWLHKLTDEPDGCAHCGAIAGGCDLYPNCPGGNSTKETTMTTMRAKMRVATVTKHGDPVNQVNLTFAAIAKSGGYPADGADEDNSFARWTPNASLQMTITNPALLDKFEVGQKFYVDFTVAP